MKTKGLIICTLLVLTGWLNAQTDFRPGYVITLAGDSLHGEIDYRGDLLMGRICRFKDAKGEITEYHPMDISAYRFVDSKYYVSRRVDEKDVFLEYLIKGELDLYLLRDDAGDHYFLEKEDIDLTRIPYKEGTRYVDNRKVYFESKDHIRLLNYTMREAPQLQSRIESMRKPGRNNLIKLAEDYHNAVCFDEECIIYAKRHPFLKVNLEAVVGVINFNAGGYDDQFYLQSGVVAHIWMPSTNEKLFFKTGLLYSQPQRSGVKRDHFTIPAHIGYIAPGTFRYRPTFSIGLFTPTYTGGLMIKLNKRTNIGVQGWADFIADGKLFMIPRRMYYYSVVGNLYIEL